jgi:hypothetical protein
MTTRPQATRRQRFRSTTFRIGPALFACGLIMISEASAQPIPGASREKIFVRADWLQAGALPLHRDALHSIDAAIEFRRTSWSAEAGYLRAARTLSTVHGGYLAVSKTFRNGDLTILPGIGILGGYAKVSLDTSGYEYTQAGTGGTVVTGHQPRYTYSSALTIGAGAMLALEYSVSSMVNLRGSVAEWVFSGTPMEPDRQRLLAGVGVSLHLPWTGVTYPAPPMNSARGAR